MMAIYRRCSQIFKMLTAVLLMAASVSMAAPCRVDMGYFVDPTAKLSAAEAFGYDYQPFTGVLNHGYTEAAVWIRVDVTACSPSSVSGDDDWVVRIRPTYFDQVALFMPALSIDSPVAYTGDTTTLATASYRSINLGFEIPMVDIKAPFFLRASTQSSNTLKVEVLTKTQAETADLQQAYLNGFILTLLTLFMIWALLQLVLDRDTFSLVFAWQQTVVVLHALFILGYGRFFLSDVLGARLVDFTTSILVLLYIGSRLLFEFYLFLQIYPPKKYVRCFYPLAFAWLGGVLTFLFYSERLGLMLNLTIGMLGIVVCLVLSSLTPERMKGASDIILPKKVLVGYFALMCLLSVSFVLPMQGITGGMDWIVDLPATLGVVSSSLVVLTLLVRRHYIEKNAKALAENLLRVEERANFEREKRAEQAHMLAVLIHEVKNPLAVAKLNLGLARDSERSHARLGRSIDNIDAIVEQCGLSLQFEQELIKPSLRRCDVTRFMNEFMDDLPYRQRLHVDLASSVAIETDPRLLKIVVTNLLDNANKYALAETTIHVRLEQQAAGGMALCVGNQVDPTLEIDPEKIFSKFYRAPSTGSQSGSGLGLYICSNISKALGLRLSVNVSEGYVEFTLCSLI